MFDKYRARFAKFEEDHESVRKIKKHLQDNQQTYLVGAGCLVGGYLLRRPNVITVINEATAPTISPVFNNHNVGNVVNNVVNNVGPCCKVVKRLEDERIWEKSIDAARELAEEKQIPLDKAKWLISRNANGAIPDVFGMHYRNIATHTLD